MSKVQSIEGDLSEYIIRYAYEHFPNFTIGKIQLVLIETEKMIADNSENICSNKIAINALIVIAANKIANEYQLPKSVFKVMDAIQSVCDPVATPIRHEDVPIARASQVAEIVQCRHVQSRINRRSVPIVALTQGANSLRPPGINNTNAKFTISFGSNVTEESKNCILDHILALIKSYAFKSYKMSYSPHQYNQDERTQIRATFDNGGSITISLASMKLLPSANQDAMNHIIELRQLGAIISEEIKALI